MPGSRSKAWVSVVRIARRVAGDHRDRGEHVGRGLAGEHAKRPDLVSPVSIRRMGGEDRLERGAGSARRRCDGRDGVSATDDDERLSAMLDGVEEIRESLRGFRGGDLPHESGYRIRLASVRLSVMEPCASREAHNLAAMNPAVSGDDRPVLIAYDGSDHARAAVKQAGALVRPRRAVVACVWATLESAAPAAALGAPASLARGGARELDAVARERAEALAAEGAALALEAGLDAESRAVSTHGSPWHGIVHCAKEIDAAAIVTGSRGRSGLAAAFLGSTAQGVLHHAHRPVIVVAGD
jgi:nucleotide-binding universal stress UspA family protein